MHLCSCRMLSQDSIRHQIQASKLELEIASKFDNATESKSFIRYNALPEARALNIGVERTSRIPKDWMVPHIQKLTLQQEIELLMDRNRLGYREILEERVWTM